MKIDKDVLADGSSEFKWTAGTLFWWDDAAVRSGPDVNNRTLADHPKVFVGFRLARDGRRDEDQDQMA